MAINFAFSSRSLFSRSLISSYVSPLSTRKLQLTNSALIYPKSPSNSIATQSSVVSSTTASISSFFLTRPYTPASSLGSFLTRSASAFTVAIVLPTLSASSSASSPKRRYSLLAQPTKLPDLIFVQPSVVSRISPPQSAYNKPIFSASSLASALTFNEFTTSAITRPDLCDSSSLSSCCASLCSEDCAAYSSKPSNTSAAPTFILITWSAPAAMAGTFPIRASDIAPAVTLVRTRSSLLFLLFVPMITSHCHIPFYISLIYGIQLLNSISIQLRILQKY